MSIRTKLAAPGDRLRRNAASALASEAEYQARKRNISEVSEKVVASTGSEVLQEVAYYIGSAAEKGALMAIRRTPRLSSFLLGIHIPEDLRFLEAGSRHVVVQKQGVAETMHVHLASTWSTRADQLRLAKQHTLQHQALRETPGLAEVVLPQSFEVTDHPFYRAPLDGIKKAVGLQRHIRSAVVGHQRAIEYTDLDLFHSQTGAVRPGALEMTAERFPDVMPQLGSYLEGVLKYHETTGMLADHTAMHALVVEEQAEGDKLWLRTGLPTPHMGLEDHNRIIQPTVHVLRQLG